MKSDKNNISVVVPAYNDIEFLKNNLQKIVSLKKDRKNLILEIIVVDDGSTDDSARYIKENFPEIRLIKHKINRGVASALNTGVRTAKGSLILMIGANLEPGKNTISFLLPHFKDPKVFGVAFNSQESCPEKPFWKDGFINFKLDKEVKEAKRIFYVRKTEGIFKRDEWIELGGMDEKLFLPFYGEDVDICFRAAKRGYTCLWEPRAMATSHLKAQTSYSKGFMEETENLHMLFFIWKNIHSASLMRKHIAGIFLKIIKNPLYIKTLLVAILKLSIVLKERRREIKESRVSDEAVFSRFSV